MSALSDRKLEHLALCVEPDVESRRGTLLDEVHLLHDALPEASLDAVDASVELFGRRLAAPAAWTRSPRSCRESVFRWS